MFEKKHLCYRTDSRSNQFCVCTAHALFSGKADGAPANRQRSGYSSCPWKFSLSLVSRTPNFCASYIYGSLLIESSSIGFEERDSKMSLAFMPNISGSGKSNKNLYYDAIALCSKMQQSLYCSWQRDTSHGYCKNLLQNLYMRTNLKKSECFMLCNKEYLREGSNTAATRC
jgi:hypothetical protein